jgi:glyoxylase-like metal-dependent hydrolase (beta-lactamase superfamily II)
MTATSARQFASVTSGDVPALEQVRPDIWALGVAMPGGHIPFSLCYLLRDSVGGIHIIDPGWDSDANWAGLEAALSSLGTTAAEVRSIIGTHRHPDHVGMADRLRSVSGAPLILHEAESTSAASGPVRQTGLADLELQLDEWAVPADRRPEFRSISLDGAENQPVTVDSTVRDGERLDIPGFDLLVIWTPGHTRGHLCLRDEVRNVMFTGDHVLPTMHAGLGLGGAATTNAVGGLGATNAVGGPGATNAVGDYLRSLAQVSAYPEHEVLPGHGYRFTGLAARATESAEHHLRRSREVAAVLSEDGEPSIWEIASRLTWSAGWENLTGFFAYSALSQTAMHRDFVTRGGLR